MFSRHACVPATRMRSRSVSTRLIAPPHIPYRPPMQIQALGNSTLSSSRLAYGGSRLAGGWTASAVTPEQIAAGIRAVAAAYEAGYTLFDNADIYCDGMCE